MIPRDLLMLKTQHTRSLFSFHTVWANYRHTGIISVLKHLALNFITTDSFRFVNNPVPSQTPDYLAGCFGGATWQDSGFSFPWFDGQIVALEMRKNHPVGA